MEQFEKKQTVEAIKTVVMARWFFVAVAIIQVVAVRLLAESLSAMPLSLLALLAGTCYGYNFLYWLYLRRPPEKMNTVGLRFVKVLQVIGDMIVISLMLYFDRTVTIFVAVFYLDVILIASILYKKLGIFLTSFFTCLLFTVLAYIEYLGFFPPIKALYYFTVKANPILLERTLILFYSGVAGAGFLSGCIATLFRKREKRLLIQRDELMTKTYILIKKTKELTKTKDQLNEALVKSVADRKDLIKIKEELMKVNLELNLRLEELEKFNKLTVGRELKMLELKEENLRLKEKIRES